MGAGRIGLPQTLSPGLLIFLKSSAFSNQQYSQNGDNR
jgi:hypothetical protein